MLFWEVKASGAIAGIKSSFASIASDQSGIVRGSIPSSTPVISVIHPAGWTVPTVLAYPSI